MNLIAILVIGTFWGLCLFLGMQDYAAFDKKCVAKNGVTVSVKRDIRRERLCVRADAFIEVPND